MLEQFSSSSLNWWHFKLELEALETRSDSLQCHLSTVRYVCHKEMTTSIVTEKTWNIKLVRQKARYIILKTLGPTPSMYPTTHG
jgi:hypothetical protein